MDINKNDKIFDGCHVVKKIISITIEKRFET